MCTEQASTDASRLEGTRDRAIGVVLYFHAWQGIQLWPGSLTARGGNDDEREPISIARVPRREQCTGGTAVGIGQRDDLAHGPPASPTRQICNRRPTSQILGGAANLDYIRGNLFDPRLMRPLPPDVVRPDNDLADLLDHYTERAIADVVMRGVAHVACTVTNPTPCTFERRMTRRLAPIDAPSTDGYLASRHAIGRMQPD